MPHPTEPNDVYQALVSALADNVLPIAVAGGTFVLVGLYGYGQTGDLLILAITIFGGWASLLKALLVILHRRVVARQPVALSTIKRFEAAHLATTWSMAGLTGALCAVLFSLSTPPLLVAATALLFGYCAGVSTRIPYRPVIAMGAVILAAGPAVTSALLFITDARWLIGTVFLVFFFAAVESITHLHRNACRLITMRLQMETLARRDPLTLLANRLGLREAFDALPLDANWAAAVHAFDLDGFKAVNDQFGHAMGDRLLQAIADRLSDLVGPGDVVARVGGDEFVVLQSGPSDALDPDLMAGRIHHRLTEPYDLGVGRPINVGLSLGYSTDTVGTASLDALIHDADAISYKVKRNGGGFRSHRVQQSSQDPVAAIAPARAKRRAANAKAGAILPIRGVPGTIA
jgi:diguanylate cyclase